MNDSKLRWHTAHPYLLLNCASAKQHKPVLFLQGREGVGEGGLICVHCIVERINCACTLIFTAQL